MENSSMQKFIGNSREIKHSETEHSRKCESRWPRTKLCSFPASLGLYKVTGTELGILCLLFSSPNSFDSSKVWHRDLLLLTVFFEF